MELKEFLERIRHYRDNRRDEIPNVLLHSTIYVDGKPVSNPPFKCRKGWFQGVYAIVSHGRNLGFVNDRANTLYEAFQKYVDETNFRVRLTTHEDIRRANEILTMIIDDLEGRLRTSG